MRSVLISFLIIALAGCAVLVKHRLDELYGLAEVRDRIVTEATLTPEYYRDVKPIVDKRCVVCHGCYDAPCQLKMSAFEAIDRGANKDKIYDGARLLAAEPGRLFVDAKTTKQWRAKKFYPVLNERDEFPQSNLEGSVLYRMLAMKNAHPLPEGDQLPSSFELGISRKQQCPRIETFDRFEQNYPLWGMPYGLPKLETKEFNIVKSWLEHGAKATKRTALPLSYQEKVLVWENFFNGIANKERLMSRYIFEHLYIANLYFSELPEGEHFNLVRSTTASGEPINVIASRRPYDAPGSETFYYRLERVKTTLVAKNHMPYRLDGARMKRWQELFLIPDYKVEELPSYEPVQASNPFLTFKDLPALSRYRFMLDEADFTISGFIKGPVCRGQIALNVINDHFWVVFAKPDEEYLKETEIFLEQEMPYLQLPAETGSQTLPVMRWLRFSRMQSKYLEAKETRRREIETSGNNVTLDYVWDGDGHNTNATLTVFRHFDSATVQKGLLGEVPKTAWLIGYPLLERIHYLLVSGFDVYGNGGHQLLTRLYMDFLRMEAERNFLSLLPVSHAKRELKFWYRDSESSIQWYIDTIADRGDDEIGIDYQTENPKFEFFHLLEDELGEEVIPYDSYNRPKPNKRYSLTHKQLQRLAATKGSLISFLPEQMILRIEKEEGDDEVFSLLSNRAHRNVLSILGEKNRLVAQEQTLSLMKGVVGSYPNVFLQVKEQAIVEFVDQLQAISSEKHYEYFLNRFAIRRTDERFWPYSDWLHAAYRKDDPIAAGLLDYNRLENR